MKTGACKFGPTCKFDHPTPGEVAAKALEAARVEVPVMLDASLSENSTLVLDDQSVLPPGTDVVVETYRSTQQVWAAEYSFDNSLGESSADIPQKA